MTRFRCVLALVFVVITGVVFVPRDGARGETVVPSLVEIRNGTVFIRSVPPGVNPIDNFHLSYPHYDRLLEQNPRIEPYLDPVISAAREYRYIFPIDPLLGLALIKHESSFRGKTVSSMGAGGLMQFIPTTGLVMGLEPIYKPELYKRGRSYHLKAGRLMAQATSAMKERDFDRMKTYLNRWETAREKADELLGTYQSELSETVREMTQEELRSFDQRFVHAEAIRAGIRYLARMMDRRKGDIREALAAYNAGPGMVRRSGGIPMIGETVRYQNRIVRTYKEYRKIASSPLE